MMFGEWLFTVLACLAMAALAVLLTYLFLRDSWRELRAGERKAILLATGICAAVVVTTFFFMAG